MANGIVNDIVNARNNFIARNKADSPVHVAVNDLANAIDKNRVKANTNIIMPESYAGLHKLI